MNDSPEYTVILNLIRLHEGFLDGTALEGLRQNVAKVESEMERALLFTHINAAQRIVKSETKSPRPDKRFTPVRISRS